MFIFDMLVKTIIVGSGKLLLHVIHFSRKIDFVLCKADKMASLSIPDLLVKAFIHVVRVLIFGWS